ncbi:MAG: transposase [Gemmatimonadota bacterium]
MQITYIPMARGFRLPRRRDGLGDSTRLSCRLSIMLDSAFCIAAVEAAIARYDRPEIFNTDQGAQFTSAAFTGLLLNHGISISMDGRSCWHDNIFVERLWRTLKYEDVYQHAYHTVSSARLLSSAISPFTIPIVRIPVSPTKPRTKHISLRCHCPWQPDPLAWSSYLTPLAVPESRTTSPLVVPSRISSATSPSSHSPCP